MNALQEIDFVIEQVGKLGMKRGLELVDLRLADGGEVTAVIRVKATHQTVTKWFQRACGDVLSNIQFDDPQHSQSSKFVVKFKAQTVEVE